MHRAWHFPEHREQARWQRPQRRPFNIRKRLTHLLPRGAVVARVRHGAFPLAQMKCRNWN